MSIFKGTGFVTLEGFEICILCLEKADPPVLFSTSIDLRIGYVEGSGQTCADTRRCQERQRVKLIKQQEGF